MQVHSFLSPKSLAASSLPTFQKLMLQQANGEIGTRSPTKTRHRRILSLSAVQLGKQQVGISSLLMMIITNGQKTVQTLSKDQGDYILKEYLPFKTSKKKSFKDFPWTSGNFSNPWNPYNSNLQEFPCSLKRKQ
jgi:hypothetical protein